MRLEAITKQLPDAVLGCLAAGVYDGQGLLPWQLWLTGSEQCPSEAKGAGRPVLARRWSSGPPRLRKLTLSTTCLVTNYTYKSKLRLYMTYTRMPRSGECQAATMLSLLIVDRCDGICDLEDWNTEGSI